MKIRLNIWWVNFGVLSFVYFALITYYLSAGIDALGDFLGAAWAFLALNAILGVVTSISERKKNEHGI